MLGLAGILPLEKYTSVHTHAQGVYTALLSAMSWEGDRSPL